VATRDDWIGAVFGVVVVWPMIGLFGTGVVVLGHQALQRFMQSGLR
jgi:hypothetical protein